MTPSSVTDYIFYRGAPRAQAGRFDSVACTAAFPPAVPSEKKLAEHGLPWLRADIQQEYASHILQLEAESRPADARLRLSVR